MSAAEKPVIALALGDPNGIGPEIAVKAAVACAEARGPRIILVGDAHVIHAAARNTAAQWKPREIGAVWPPEPSSEHQNALYFFPVAALALADLAPGTVSAAAGRATVAYVEAALGLARAGRADALVACPHSETAVNAAGIAFSGYPSLLARLSGLPEDRVFLMLVGGGLRIVHTTLHERLADALRRLSPDLVVAAGIAAAAALRRMGIDAPLLGVFGINPHAGEGGLFGDDDRAITTPAAARLRALGEDVEGPLGADLFLARHAEDAAVRLADAYIAMYHDQGHIPIKLRAGRRAVALAIGAGPLFASVGHGSAFDIAGQGHADPASLLRAIALVSGTSDATLGAEVS